MGRFHFSIDLLLVDKYTEVAKGGAGMIDLGIFALIMWVGCFITVAVDSVLRGISPRFWRVAALFGGPFALLAYGIVRSKN